MAGDLITCPSCQGWTPAETGWLCTLCDGEGCIWDEYPDDDYGDYEGFDAGEWNNAPADPVQADGQSLTADATG